MRYGLRSVRIALDHCGDRRRSQPAGANHEVPRAPHRSAAVMAVSLVCGAACLGQDRQSLTAEEQQTLGRELQELQASIDALHERALEAADAAITKRLSWVLRYD